MPKQANEYPEPGTRRRQYSRQGVERMIVRRFAREFIDEGFHITIDNGGGESAKTRSYRKVMEEVMATNEDQLRVYKLVGDQYIFKGWVHFIYGNDGHDVISDYSVALEEDLVNVFAYARSFEGAIYA